MGRAEIAPAMARTQAESKVHRIFTRIDDHRRPWPRRGGAGQAKAGPMAPIALTMFVSLFAFGASYFGWEDPGGKVQLALFAAFLFGIICGYKVKT